MRIHTHTHTHTPTHTHTLELPVSSGRKRLNHMRSPAVNHSSPRQPAVTPSPISISGSDPSTGDRRAPETTRDNHRSSIRATSSAVTFGYKAHSLSQSDLICLSLLSRSVWAFSGSRAAMVKLGSNLSDKLEKQPSADDGFDNIPLITPLEVNQLHKPYADKVIVKTSTQYQLQQKKNKLYVPNIKKLNINFYSDVSEKAKITGLILITLAFLTSLLLLLMYKAMWYDQLTCPEGFILKKHCTPAALEMYYTEQQQQQQEEDEEPGVRGGANAGLYAALSHLNQVKRTGPELPSPWLPVISALKEAEVAKQGGEQLKRELEGEE
ncbi:calcyon neuron-specific vesicular protein isoform X2 [Sebastes umbrosus]|uniref:calcyon neuron-specific vesicular protein isoform X2 n=1 Tax=Sebastes umbrosus TaxID=72105 RepID=UPI0018A01571|nr:calcyon neuron-specific vesicular protein isoform X2 [Sebastes umbrosus]